MTATNFQGMYWSVTQQLAHLRSGEVKLEVGDLIGSGTVSGTDPGSEGSLVERGGPYLEDGDVVVFYGYARNERTTVAFGEMRMEIHAAAAC